MKVSVIINCHNGEPFVGETLACCFNQSYENFEVIFFDNCSYDGTAAILRGIKDPRLKYFRSNTFLSLGQARNEALKYANGDLIAFLDADDIWLPNKLELQVPLFESGVGLVYTTAQMFYANETQKIVSEKPIEGNVFGTLLGAYFLVMSSVVISRAALESLTHWFDHRFEIIEEYDLFVRIAATWQIRHVSEQVTKWRWHEGSTTFTKSKLIAKEKRIFLRKLRKEFPDLYAIHINDVNRVRSKILITIALRLYRQNKGAKARALLRKSNRISKKGLFVYLASFFPSAFIDSAYRHTKGNPLI